MRIAYLKFVLRRQWKAYALIFFADALLVLVAGFWPQLKLLQFAAQMFSSIVGAVICFLYGYSFYRSIYGADATLVHQIAVPARFLLHMHVLIAAMMQLIASLLCLWGTAGIPGIRAGFEGAQTAALDTNSASGAEAVNWFLTQGLFFSGANIFDIFLFIIWLLLTSLASALMLYAVICFAARKGARNRLLNFVICYIVISFVISFTYVFCYVLAFALHFWLQKAFVLTLFEHFKRADFAQLTDILITLRRSIFCLSIVCNLVWNGIMYFYCRRQMEDKLVVSG